MKKNIITRKIQILLNYDQRDKIKDGYATLFRWQNIVYRSANLIATHQFLQESIKDMLYLTEETKVKLGNVTKDEQGILSTSRLNSTYQMLSKQFKGEVPMAIMTALNSQIVSVFNTERKDYFLGKRSLRSYKRNIPIPIQSQSITKIEKIENDYTFQLFGISFKTRFGVDKSGNRDIFERSLEKQYKFCDSSISLDGNKIYLLAVFSFDAPDAPDVKKDHIAYVNLSIEYPLEVTIGKKTVQIGNKEEYLYRRLAIQKALRRTQMSARYNKGGKGRKKKLKSIEQFHDQEKKYINSRCHAYSAKLIDLCRKFKAGTICLENMVFVEQQAEENEFLLRNWSYYGLRDKITYKARKFGIDVIEPKLNDTSDNKAN